MPTAGLIKEPLPVVQTSAETEQILTLLCKNTSLFYWFSIITIAHNQFEQSKIFIEIHRALNEQSSVFSRGLEETCEQSENFTSHGAMVSPPEQISCISWYKQIKPIKTNKKPCVQTAQQHADPSILTTQHGNIRSHMITSSFTKADRKLRESLPGRIDAYCNLAEQMCKAAHTGLLTWIWFWFWFFFTFWFISWHIFWKEEEEGEQSFLRFYPWRSNLSPGKSPTQIYVPVDGCSNKLRR